MIEIFQRIKSYGGDIIIIRFVEAFYHPWLIEKYSDANTVYINEILQAKNISHYISDIITNPGSWDDAGRLHVKRRVIDPPHGCTNSCSVNLCKGNNIFRLSCHLIFCILTLKQGNELLQWISQNDHKYDRIFYGGDGKNDYCPSTKLNSQDFALFRYGHSLEVLLKKNPDYVKRISATVKWWSTADELLDIFNELL